jgi:hypothetical protein
MLRTGRIILAIQKFLGMGKPGDQVILLAVYDTADRHPAAFRLLRNDVVQYTLITEFRLIQSSEILVMKRIVNLKNRTGIIEKVRFNKGPDFGAKDKLVVAENKVISQCIEQKQKKQNYCE